MQMQSNWQLIMNLKKGGRALSEHIMKSFESSNCHREEQSKAEFFCAV